MFREDRSTNVVIFYTAVGFFRLISRNLPDKPDSIADFRNIL